MNWNKIDMTIAEMEKKGMTTEVSFKWCAGDILGTNPNLTMQQVEDVLTLMERRHDCTVGINWDVVQCSIDEILSDSEEGE